MVRKNTGARRKRTNTPVHNRQRAVSFRHQKYAVSVTENKEKFSWKKAGRKVADKVKKIDVPWFWKNFTNTVSYSVKGAVSTWNEMEWDFKPEAIDPKFIIPEEELVYDENGKIVSEPYGTLFKNALYDLSLTKDTFNKYVLLPDLNYTAMKYALEKAGVFVRAKTGEISFKPLPLEPQDIQFAKYDEDGNLCYEESSFSDDFKSAVESADLKELIPVFYNDSGEKISLFAYLGLKFSGTKAEKETEDVQIPSVTDLASEETLVADINVLSEGIAVTEEENAVPETQVSLAMSEYTPTASKKLETEEEEDIEDTAEETDIIETETETTVDTSAESEDAVEESESEAQDVIEDIAEETAEEDDLSADTEIESAEAEEETEIADEAEEIIAEETDQTDEADSEQAEIPAEEDEEIDRTESEDESSQEIIEENKQEPVIESENGERKLSLKERLIDFVASGDQEVRDYLLGNITESTEEVKAETETAAGIFSKIKNSVIALIPHAEEQQSLPEKTEELTEAEEVSVSDEIAEEAVAETIAEAVSVIPETEEPEEAESEETEVISEAEEAGPEKESAEELLEEEEEQTAEESADITEETETEVTEEESEAEEQVEIEPEIVDVIENEEPEEQDETESESADEVETEETEEPAEAEYEETETPEPEEAIPEEVSEISEEIEEIAESEEETETEEHESESSEETTAEEEAESEESELDIELPEPVAEEPTESVTVAEPSEIEPAEAAALTLFERIAAAFRRLFRQPDEIADVIEQGNIAEEENEIAEPTEVNLSAEEEVIPESETESADETVSEEAAEETVTDEDAEEAEEQEEAESESADEAETEETEEPAEAESEETETPEPEEVIPEEVSEISEETESEIAESDEETEPAEITPIEKSEEEPEPEEEKPEVSVIPEAEEPEEAEPEETEVIPEAEEAEPEKEAAETETEETPESETAEPEEPIPPFIAPEREKEQIQPFIPSVMQEETPEEEVPEVPQPEEVSEPILSVPVTETVTEAEPSLWQKFKEAFSNWAIRPEPLDDDSLIDSEQKAGESAEPEEEEEVDFEKLDELVESFDELDRDIDISISDVLGHQDAVKPKQSEEEIPPAVIPEETVTEEEKPAEKEEVIPAAIAAAVAETVISETKKEEPAKAEPSEAEIPEASVVSELAAKEQEETQKETEKEETGSVSEKPAEEKAKESAAPAISASPVLSLAKELEQSPESIGQWFALRKARNEVINDISYEYMLDRPRSSILKTLIWPAREMDRMAEVSYPTFSIPLIFFMNLIKWLAFGAFIAMNIQHGINENTFSVVRLNFSHTANLAVKIGLFSLCMEYLVYFIFATVCGLMRREISIHKLSSLIARLCGIISVLYILACLGYLINPIIGWAVFIAATAYFAYLFWHGCDLALPTKRFVIVIMMIISAVIIFSLARFSMDFIMKEVNAIYPLMRG